MRRAALVERSLAKTDYPWLFCDFAVSLTE
jgi:hypothetical protein